MDWYKLTEKIRCELEKLAGDRRSQARMERQKKLSEILLAADCFRLVWRNHVAHARQKYEDAEARRALGFVGEYLAKLSAALEK